jgi:hypothetical protein
MVDSLLLFYVTTSSGGRCSRLTFRRLESREHMLGGCIVRSFLRIHHSYVLMALERCCAWSRPSGKVRSVRQAISVCDHEGRTISQSRDVMLGPTHNLG